MFVFRRFLATIAAGALAATTLAWNATGHMVIADIAFAKLKPKVAVEALRLLQIGGTPKTRDFLGAGPWADDTRTRENGPWHYIDLYFRKDGQTTSLQPDKENVVWAINRFSKILADRAQPDADRADALRYLIHFVGDIHQPLHCTALVSDQFPSGDRGGNLYAVEPRAGTDRPHNLHYLWDEGGSLFPRVERPLTPEGKAKIDALASQCLAATPSRTLASAARVTDPMQWALEGQSLAKSFVYSTPDGQTPSLGYIAKVKSISENRVAIAGERLADLLNRLLAS